MQSADLTVLVLGPWVLHLYCSKLCFSLAAVLAPCCTNCCTCSLQCWHPTLVPQFVTLGSPNVKSEADVIEHFPTSCFKPGLQNVWQLALQHSSVLIFLSFCLVNIHLQISKQRNVSLNFLCWLQRHPIFQVKHFKFYYLSLNFLCWLQRHPIFQVFFCAPAFPSANAMFG